MIYISMCKCWSLLCLCCGILQPCQIIVKSLCEANSWCDPDWATCYTLCVILMFAVSRAIILRGHLEVPDIVSEPLIVPLNFLVILLLIHLKAYILWKADRLKGILSTWLQKLNASTGIEIVHLGPPDIPLTIPRSTKQLLQLSA